MTVIDIGPEKVSTEIKVANIGSKPDLDLSPKNVTAPAQIPAAGDNGLNDSFVSSTSDIGPRGHRHKRALNATPSERNPFDESRVTSTGGVDMELELAEARSQQTQPLNKEKGLHTTPLGYEVFIGLNVQTPGVNITQCFLLHHWKWSSVNLIIYRHQVLVERQKVDP